MAFILVQHLDPTRESALSDILSRATSLRVTEVTRELPVRPDNIYVIAPGSDLVIADGTLKLQPRKLTGGAHRSIDLFFASLAQDQRERAIGVILSGTASDGTLGLEAIRGEGGLTFAQDDSARYDSMPRSAIAAGCVDLVLSPQDIAAELGRIAKHPLVVGSAAEQLTQSEDDRATATAHEDDGSPLPSGGHGAPRTGARTVRAESAAAQDTALNSGFKKILLLLRNHCGVDFSLYKSATIQRRTTRRMVLNKQHTLEDYCRFLRGNAKELDALYSDVLISVTSFFRNPEAFDILKRKVFQKLLQRRGDDPLRVWVLGCSTGQEAYSLAMAFVETVENVRGGARNLQVFATDLNEALLNKARHGLYAKSLVADITPERLRRFFVEEEDGYRITKSLREMVVFARQNLMSDPPFSRMDLVSCRNLLIYLEPSLQKALLPTFHYALKPGGYLFLGSSESIGSFTDLFEPIDKKHKVYAKKAASRQTLTLPARKEPGDRPPVMRRLQRLSAVEKGQGQPDNFRTELNLLREADRIAINKYAPPAVLINAEFQILQFRGPTSVYLEPPTGKASFSLLKMAREGLRPSLQAVLNRAKEENIVVRTDNAQLKQNGKPQKVSIEVIPLKNLKERSYLVVFDDVRKAVTSPTAHERSRGKILRSSRAERRHVADVERELSETRDFLQSVQEQNEAVNAELQGSNEEVQSANEELQSINEELETAKEELESTNEELTTVNEELANRNFELNRLNSDLVNLQTSTHLAIVLVGRDLTIRRSSIRAKQAFNLLASDIGRSLNDVRHNLDFPDLETFVRNVISSVREAEREVRDKNGHWYSLRVRPYLTLDNKVDGAVLVLIDINLLKRTQLAITEAGEQIEAIVRTVPDPLVVLEPDLTIRSANEAFYHTFRLAPPDTEGRSIFELDEASWDIPSLRRLLEDIIPHSSFFNAYEITHEFKRVGRCTMLLNARMLLQTDGKPKLILLGIRDITERKEAEERQNLLTDELAHRSKNLLAVIQSIASRSLSGKRSLNEAREVFLQRIQALSRGQSALLSEGVEGASLVRTIQLELEAFSEQIDTSGPDLVLHARIAQTFTLLIHELATNASKHGALSRPEGKIVVRWLVEGGGADARFKFQWQERNGPPVQPPSHQGFGHILLELAGTDFDASPVIDFSPGGFRYEIDAPLSAIVKQRSRKHDS